MFFCTYIIVCLYLFQIEHEDALPPVLVERREIPAEVARMVSKQHIGIVEVPKHIEYIMEKAARKGAMCLLFLDTILVYYYIAARNTFIYGNS